MHNQLNQKFTRIGTKLPWAFGVQSMSNPCRCKQGFRCTHSRELRRLSVPFVPLDFAVFLRLQRPVTSYRKNLRVYESSQVSLSLSISISHMQLDHTCFHTGSLNVLCFHTFIPSWLKSLLIHHPLPSFLSQATLFQQPILSSVAFPKKNEN